jgi:hypothetical protein
MCLSSWEKQEGRGLLVLAGYIGILQSLKCHKICDFSIWWMKNKNFLSTVMFFFFVEFDKNWVRLSYCGCLLIILKLAMKPFVLIVLCIVWLRLLWIHDTHAYFFTAENWNTLVLPIISMSKKQWHKYGTWYGHRHVDKKWHNSI